MRRLLALLIVTLPALPTFGWNAFGHEAVAYLAWQRLTPAQQQNYTAILKTHPHYDDELANGLAPDDKDRDMHVFMKAATWPDIIRGTKNADEKADAHSNWHYIDKPITPDHAQVEEPKIELTTDVPQNAVQAVRFELNILNNKRADSASRAKALCWVLHIVGDLHQPLHCVSLYDVDFPQGDRGGNSISIVPSETRQNLHGLWDGILGQRGDMDAVAKTADESTRDYAAAVQDRAKDLDAVHWAVEGRDLSAKIVYATLELDSKGELLANVDRKAVTPDRDYLRRARDTARAQLVLAGARLAGTLSQ